MLGLLLLSAWLPAMVARSNHESWQAGQFLYRWVLLMFTAVWWLPLGWLGYLATLQASIQLPATVQNIIFNTRYDWLPVAGPLWLLGWLISWKWLPALQRQLTAPTSWLTAPLAHTMPPLMIAITSQLIRNSHTFRLFLKTVHQEIRQPVRQYLCQLAGPNNCCWSAGNHFQLTSQPSNQSGANSGSQS